jgi:hypothetical protein
MRVSTLGRQDTGRPFSTHAKFPAPCLPVTWEESLQAVAGRTLKNYKDELRPLLQKEQIMHSLTLSDDERALLLALLENRLKGLSHEIHQTDSHAYRDSLIADQHTLEQLATKLQKS